MCEHLARYGNLKSPVIKHAGLEPAKSQALLRLSALPTELMLIKKVSY